MTDKKHIVQGFCVEIVKEKGDKKKKAVVKKYLKEYTRCGFGRRSTDITDVDEIVCGMCAYSAEHKDSDNLNTPEEALHAIAKAVGDTTHLDLLRNNNAVLDHVLDLRNQIRKAKEEKEDLAEWKETWETTFSKGYLSTLFAIWKHKQEK